MLPVFARDGYLGQAERGQAQGKVVSIVQFASGNLQQQAMALRHNLDGFLPLVPVTLQLAQRAPP